MKLNNKVVVVTGACGGIGQTIVEKFVAEGAQVIAADMNQQAVEELAKSFGAKVVGVVADVTVFSQVEAMIEAAVENFGTIDITWTCKETLIHNQCTN